MRTTLNIDDSLFSQAKHHSQQQGLSVGHIVDQALRLFFLTRPSCAQIPDLPIFTRGTGLRSGIDPSSNAALFDAMEEDA